MARKDDQIFVRLSPEEKLVAEELARASARSVSSLVRWLLQQEAERMKINRHADEQSSRPAA